MSRECLALPSPELVISPESCSCFKFEGGAPSPPDAGVRSAAEENTAWMEIEQKEYVSTFPDLPGAGTVPATEVRPPLKRRKLAAYAIRESIRRRWFTRFGVSGLRVGVSRLGISVQVSGLGLNKVACAHLPFPSSLLAALNKLYLRSAWALEPFLR